MAIRSPFTGRAAWSRLESFRRKAACSPSSRPLHRSHPGRAIRSSSRTSWTSRANGTWHDRRSTSKRDVPLLPAAPDGVTALAGQVLRLSGEPLEGVSVKLGAVTATTDRNGQFLLQGVADGFGILEVDGDVTGADS